MSVAVRLFFVLAILVTVGGIGILFARVGYPSIPSLEASEAPTIELQQSGITATPIPTETLLVSTSTIVPSSSNSVPTPLNSVEQFIHTYFQAINSRNYENTWSLLSESFQASRNSAENGGYQGYVDFWNTVDRVEILEIRILEQSSQSAEVFVVANYHYKNGATTTGESTYYIVYDFTRNTWLFDVPH